MYHILCQGSFRHNNLCYRVSQQEHYPLKIKSSCLNGAGTYIQACRFPLHSGINALKQEKVVRIKSEWSLVKPMSLSWGQTNKTHKNLTWVFFLKQVWADDFTQQHKPVTVLLGGRSNRNLRFSLLMLLFLAMADHPNDHQTNAFHYTMEKLLSGKLSVMSVQRSKDAQRRVTNACRAVGSELPRQALGFWSSQNLNISNGKVTQKMLSNTSEESMTQVCPASCQAPGTGQGHTREEP